MIFLLYKPFSVQSTGSPTPAPPEITGTSWQSTQPTTSNTESSTLSTTPGYTDSSTQTHYTTEPWIESTTSPTTSGSESTTTPTEGTTSPSSSTLTTTSSSTDITSTMTSETTEPGSTMEPCPIGQLEGDQVALVCPTGFRRHPKYCNLFYQCTKEENSHAFNILVLSCPDNLIYDNDKVQCLPPNETQSCNGQIATRHLYRKLDDNFMPPVSTFF